MLYLLSVFSGAMIAIMISINGVLSTRIGTQEATIIFVIFGLILSSILSIRVKDKTKEKLPLWMYTGGVFNALTIWFNNLAFGTISVSAILAISLFGQVVVSAFVDHYAMFGLEKRPFDKQKMIGFFIVCLGLVVMSLPLQAGTFMAIFITLITGFCVVFNRIVSAELAKKRSLQKSVFWNFFIASLSLLLLSKVFYNTSLSNTYSSMLESNPLLLTGAVFAVAIVLATNYLSPRVASYYLTLLLFIGQIFSGIALDIILSARFSLQNFLGGLLVLAGLLLNMLFDYQKWKNATKKS